MGIDHMAWKGVFLFRKDRANIGVHNSEDEDHDPQV